MDVDAPDLAPGPAMDQHRLGRRVQVRRVRRSRVDAEAPHVDLEDVIGIDGGLRLSGPEVQRSALESPLGEAGRHVHAPVGRIETRARAARLDFLGDTRAGTHDGRDRIISDAEVVEAGEKLRRRRFDEAHGERPVLELIVGQIVLPPAAGGGKQKGAGEKPADETICLGVATHLLSFPLLNVGVAVAPAINARPVPDQALDASRCSTGCWGPWRLAGIVRCPYLWTALCPLY